MRPKRKLTLRRVWNTRRNGKAVSLSCEPGARHLIEQRLEQVEIILIDQYDLIITLA